MGKHNALKIKLIVDEMVKAGDDHIHAEVIVFGKHQAAVDQNRALRRAK